MRIKHTHHRPSRSSIVIKIKVKKKEQFFIFDPEIGVAFCGWVTRFTPLIVNNHHFNPETKDEYFEFTFLEQLEKKFVVGEVKGSVSFNDGTVTRFSLSGQQVTFTNIKDISNYGLDHIIRVVDLSEYPILVESWEHPEAGRVHVYYRYKRPGMEAQILAVPEGIWITSDGKRFPLTDVKGQLHVPEYWLDGGKVFFSGGVLTICERMFNMNCVQR
jgi:hypothetical protein